MFSNDFFFNWSIIICSSHLPNHCFWDAAWDCISATNALFWILVSQCHSKIKRHTNPSWSTMKLNYTLGTPTALKTKKPYKWTSLYGYKCGQHQHIIEFIWQGNPLTQRQHKGYKILMINWKLLPTTPFYTLNPEIITWFYLFMQHRNICVAWHLYWQFHLHQILS